MAADTGEDRRTSNPADIAANNLWDVVIGIFYFVLHGTGYLLLGVHLMSPYQADKSIFEKSSI